MLSLLEIMRTDLYKQTDRRMFLSFTLLVKCFGFSKLQFGVYFTEDIDNKRLLLGFFDLFVLFSYLFSFRYFNVKIVILEKSLNIYYSL